MRVRDASLAAPLITVAALCLCLGCQPQAAGPTIDVETMNKLVELSFQASSEGKLELCDEVFAADFVRHTVERGDLVGP